VNEAVTHANTLLETIDARGLGTVVSFQVKDLKAMLQHDDSPYAPEAKENWVHLGDRVLALAIVKEATPEFATAAPERATVAPAVHSDIEQAPRSGVRLRPPPPIPPWPPPRPCRPCCRHEIVNEILR
jgi:hypothetical protein